MCIYIYINTYKCVYIYNTIYSHVGDGRSPDPRRALRRRGLRPAGARRPNKK